MKLKYLFKVVFVDGSEYKQTAEDVSAIDITKSCFYDVVNSGKKIKTFEIGNFWKRFKVDLTDGHFEINGETVWLSENPLPIEKELFFQRQNEQDASFLVKESQLVFQKTLGHRVAYLLGWENKEQGIKQIIKVK